MSMHNDDLFFDDAPIKLEPTKPRKHYLAACESCPLYDRPFVPTCDPADNGIIPVIAVVGEAPGYEEAKQGVPFVGPSGQLLHATLERVGVTREKVFKTNAVLCQPYQNEQPTQNALRACQERLRADLAALPDIPIVSAGAVATEALDALASYATHDGIMRRRGNSYPIEFSFQIEPYRDDYDYWQRTYHAIFHPAYVLRNADSFETFRADLDRIINAGQNTINWLDTKYMVVTEANYADLFDQWAALENNKALLAIDTETNGLQWWNTPSQVGADLINIVFAFDEKEAFIIPVQLLQDFDIVQFSLQYLFNRCTVITHNGMFDAQILKQVGIELTLAHDTMLASFALNELKGYHRLKYLATQLLNAPDYERAILGDSFIDLPPEERDYSTLPLDKLYHYAAIDVCVTLALHKELQPRLLVDNVQGAYEVLMKGAETVIAVERNGIKIDREYLLKLQDYITEDLTHRTIDMWDCILDRVNYQIDQGNNPTIVIDPPYYKERKYLIAPNAMPATKGKNRAIYKNFNPASVSQMQWALYELLKLKHQIPLGFGTKPTSTNVEALNALPDHAFVRALKAHRTASTMQKMYVNKLLDIADTSDRVHVRFNLNGTEVGRLSADDSLHGIPRPEDFYGKAIRGSFIADESNVLVVADYGQAELRVIAANSKEPFFLDAFNAPMIHNHSVAHMRYPDLYDNGSDIQRKLLAKLVGDLHCQTAAFLFTEYEREEIENILRGVFGEGLAKKLRTFAKNFNFGTVYQGGAEGIWSMTHGALPLPLVKELQEKHKARTPILQQYCKDQFRFAKKYGYVQTRFGRKRRFPLLTADNIQDVRKASVHMPTASEASDLTLLSAHSLVKDGVQVGHMVHDSIIAECKANEATDVSQLMQSTMIKMGELWFPEVKWEADIEVNKRWYQNRPELN